ncbi:hypothetical protein [Streptosporangium saharense]|uniref:Uncharacterized protein n=1 Tax=Streptosporangium saharense TaxID=1706840 RepID=A0A7W7QHR1_9ACTN|nr:hypothetical protein [Streptosporangium saharense]MBB4913825.1 hypothetical protein [Streptosporangium saharense]
MAALDDLVDADLLLELLLVEALHGEAERLASGRRTGPDSGEGSRGPGPASRRLQ